MGRNYIDTGLYLEQIFPFLNVRFIAINDVIDSHKESVMDNMMIPFKNFINDAYLRDISVKIRSQFEVKRKKGEYIGSFSPYGYQKSPTNNNLLIIDDKAAEVVRDIFKWKMEGMSINTIANRLNSRGVLSPMEYKIANGYKFKTSFKVYDKTKWNYNTILRMLKDEVYIGTISQGKRMTPNYKIKKRVEKSKEEWVSVENVHDPIITTELFQTVQEVLLKDTRIRPNGKKVYLLSGMLSCGDCGNSLVRKTMKRGDKSYVYYVCSTYKNHKQCSSHSIKEEELQEAILFVIRQHIATIISMEKVLSSLDQKAMQSNEIKKIRELIQQSETDLEKVRRFKVTIYEDFTDGVIKKNDYKDMKEIYDIRSSEIKEILTNLYEELDHIQNEISPRSEWINRFKKFQFTNILTRELLVTLVDEVVVYEDKKIEIGFKYEGAFNNALAYIEGVIEDESEGIGSHATAPMLEVM